MVERFHSLKRELIYDLSLLSLCALVLSGSVLLILLRISIPVKLEPLVEPYFRSVHQGFLESSEYREALEGGEKNDISVALAFDEYIAKAWASSRWPRLRLTIDQTVDPAYEIHRNHENFLFVIPAISSFEWVGEGLSDQRLRYALSVDPIHAALTMIKYQVFLITLLISAVLVVIGYFLLFKRNIFVPVRSLSRVSEAFMNGNLAARVDVERNDELGQVANALNTMAKNVQEKEKKLILTIQSLKVANEELEATKNEQLQIEKLASVGRLAAGVAHEVGNPLGAILGYLDILRRSMRKQSEVKKEDVELCDRIEDETNRISKIIRALLKQARPPQERIQQVRLIDIVRKSLELAQVADPINVILEFEEESAEAQAEGDQLTQVFLNLLINAKYAIETKEYKNNEQPQIKIRCVRRKLPAYSTADTASNSVLDSSVVRALKPVEYWVVNVEDNGVGISDEDQRKLFEPFFSTKDTGKGTGLGLYVSKSIIESFHGAIVVRSALGYGTAFSVFLPIATEA